MPVIPAAPMPTKTLIVSDSRAGKRLDLFIQHRRTSFRAVDSALQSPVIWICSSSAPAPKGRCFCMMPDIQDISRKLREVMPVLQQQYKVSRLEIFGSYARGEQRGASDIDVLVDLSGTIDLIAFIALENFLSDTIGVKVDLVMRDTLKPRIKDAILREAVPL